MNQKQSWEEANKWESLWWKNPDFGTTNSLYEEDKQANVYSEKMGLNFSKWKSIDMKGKSILDIGGGPVSMLLKCSNTKRKMVIDPLIDQYPEWTRLRYKEAGIEVKAQMGEEIEETGWDEVWIYNVLQHVMDPKELLKRAMKAGSKLRIFEWLNTGVSDGHIHNLTKEMLDEILGIDGNTAWIDLKDETYCMCYYGSFNLEEGKINIKPKATRQRPKKLRFHVPGIPHTITNKDYISCAFTQKVLKICKMLTELGHEVYHYGCEGSNPICTENVQIITNEYRKQFYADDSRDKQFRYDTSDELHHVYHQKCIEEIQKRKGNTDFLLCSWGWGHKPIADAFEGTDLLVVESGIGYKDTFAKFRVFESYNWMHWVYGKENTNTGLFYDAVIPNYFDLDDFKFNDKKEDWFLYLGRIIRNKGIGLAVEVTEAINSRLVIAGQGSLYNPNEGIDFRAPHIDFAGYADVEKRKELMSKAKAVFVPTYYIEPFGGVTIEAMLSGTPVITTDFGVFSETVIHGVTGYRCHTKEQFIWAANNIDKINPQDCRDWAEKNYSMERVALMYDEYFYMLDGLRGQGWPEPNESRTELDWLKRYYP